MDSLLSTFEKRARENKNFTPKMKDILQASLTLFSQQGYSNTSTRDIAKKAQVAEGTIFKHFGTKENLLYSTLFPLLKLSLAEEWEKEITPVTNNIQNYSFEGFLREVLESKIIHAEDTLKVFKILTLEYLYQESLRNKLFTLVPEIIIKDINKVLNYYKDKKQIVDLSNKELFRFLIGTLMSFVLSNDLMPSHQEEKLKELNNLIVFVTKGLSPQ